MILDSRVLADDFCVLLMGIVGFLKCLIPEWLRDSWIWGSNRWVFGFELSWERFGYLRLKFGCKIGSLVEFKFKSCAFELTFVSS